jgi:hypothetical protein
MHKVKPLHDFKRKFYEISRLSMFDQMVDTYGWHLYKYRRDPANAPAATKVVLKQTDSWLM